MGETPRERSDDLATIFVDLTGEETVIDSQIDDGSNRELAVDTNVEAAVDDGLDGAIEGMGQDGTDPGDVAE